MQALVDKYGTQPHFLICLNVIEIIVQQLWSYLGQRFLLATLKGFYIRETVLRHTKILRLSPVLISYGITVFLSYYTLTLST
ncbi:hypothetical protein J2X77_003536 [Sphingobacterium sp. 2149]|nr:hypothetical protein [Sphingobacterium sp. 2149]